MNPRLLAFAAYFALCGYAFAKTGADKRLAALLHQEYGRLSQISAKALVDEMAARKELVGSGKN